MIHRCPNCGSPLAQPLNCGLRLCNKCRVIFEANDYSNILSASWELRKSKNICPEQLQFMTQLPKADIDLIYHYIIEEGYPHDTFIKLLKEKKGFENESEHF